MGKNWSGIKIYQYQKIDKLITDKEIDLFEKQIRLVQIVFKLNNKQIDEIPVTDFNERFIPEIDFIFTTKPNNKIPIYFEIGKIKYVFEPRVDNLTAGQYIELSTLCKDQNKIIDNLHFILSVICLPEKTKYDSETVIDRSNLFQKELSISIAYPIALFFYQLYLNLIKNIPQFLTTEMKNLNKALEMVIITNGLPKNGDGIASLTHSPVATLTNGNISQN